MKLRISPREKDMLWHGGKALLCALQLWLLDILTRYRVAYFIEWLSRELILNKTQQNLTFLLYPLISVILFVVLWRYYDTIDDYSFNRICNAPEFPKFLRDPGFVAGFVLTILTGTPILLSAFRHTLSRFGVGALLTVGISFVLALGITIGVSLLRLSNLEYTWRVQKDLRTSTAKTQTKLFRRIFYAVLFFVALYLLIPLGFNVLLPAWGSLVIGVFTIMLRPILPVLAVLLIPLLAIRMIRRLSARRKFLKRLEALRGRGELSYTVHGHPYLSALFPKVFFGLSITDAPHPDGKKKTDTTYTVGFINPSHRKGTIILCDNQVYRFMYALRMRGIGGIRGGGNLIYGAQFVSVPAGAWYTNHSFRFPDVPPEEVGERILVIDPTPRVLALHGRRADELITLDNASKVYGYTVYGKNSFLNMLERT